MMAVLSILFLLLALADITAGLAFRKYVYNDKVSSWSDAQTYCRANYTDLSIFSSQLDFDNFVNQTISTKHEACWIGLNNNPEEITFTHWTDGSELKFSKWKIGQPDHTDKDHCVFISNNEMQIEDCSVKKKSYCYTWAPQMIVVQKMKSWEEALVHCRTYYTDLVSITMETDLDRVSNIETEVLTPAFWTGLRFMDGSWFWVNQDSMESLAAMPSCPASPYHCGALNLGDGVWENRDCEERMNFICYHDPW